MTAVADTDAAIIDVMANPNELVGRFHGAIILLERFDNENIRPHIETKANHPPREFAITATYLRTLAHVRTMIHFNNAAHFQAISMVARAIFELAVDIRLLDQIDEGPARYAAFSKVERLRVARRIVEFHNQNTAIHAERELPDVDPVEPFWVYEKLISENATEIDELAQRFWPKQFENKKTVLHWSGKDLRQRAIQLGLLFHEVYDVNYAELSWYTHPGVGVIATLDQEIYPIICGKAFGIAIRCYCETLRFMIHELQLSESDKQVENKLEFARLAAFSDNEQQASELRQALLGY